MPVARKAQSLATKFFWNHKMEPKKAEMNISYLAGTVFEMSGNA